jgi:hypothetical protein
MVLENENGDILRTAAGQALAKNYDFGNAFLAQNNIAIFIDVPALVGRAFTDDAFSMVMWEQNAAVPASAKGTYGIGNAAKTSYVRFSPGGTGVSQQMQRGINGAGAVAVCTAYNIVAKEAVFSAYAQDKNGTNARLGTNIIPATEAAKAMTGFTVGYLTIGKETQLNRTCAFAFGEFYFFDRKLTQVEIDRLYNNNRGVELLTNKNLLLHYKFDKAEILDFSAAQDGSQLKVGVRNLGTLVNGHGEFKGLPAGTLQQQADFANANWFKKWIA